MDGNVKPLNLQTTSTTVLRDHSISSSNVSPLMSFRRWQQGQRSSLRTNPTINSLRTVAIDVGLCRSVLTAGSAAWPTSGYSRFLESRFAAISSGGKKTSLPHQECVGRYAHRRVMMKPSPFPPFIMAKPDLLLQFLVVSLDPPSQLRIIDQLLHTSWLWQGREPIFSRLTVAFGPFYQQPLFCSLLASQIVPMRRSHSHCCKARTHPPARPFSPTHFAKLTYWQAQGQGFDR